MAGTVRLAALSAVLLTVGSPAGFADQSDSSSFSLGFGSGFLTRPAPNAYGVSLSLIAPDAGPDAQLGLAPARGGAVDFDWGSGFRTELRSDLVETTPPPGAPAHPGNGSSQASFTGNVLYDFGVPGTALDAHIGGGIGIDSLHAGFGQNSDLLAYQFLAGTEYAVRPDLKLGAEYRFLGAADFTGMPQRYNPTGHSLLLTLRYDWGATDPLRQSIAPPPALTAATALETPAPALDPVRGFEVAFDTDQAVLTGAAADTLREAAESVKAGNHVRIAISGRADTVGTVEHTLSDRRSLVVRRFLEQQGLPGADFAGTGPVRSDQAPVEIIAQ